MYANIWGNKQGFYEHSKIKFWSINCKKLSFYLYINSDLIENTNENKFKITNFN